MRQAARGPRRASVLAARQMDCELDGSLSTAWKEQLPVPGVDQEWFGCA